MPNSLVSLYIQKKQQQQQNNNNNNNNRPTTTTKTNSTRRSTTTTFGWRYFQSYLTMVSFIIRKHLHETLYQRCTYNYNIHGRVDVQWRKGPPWPQKKFQKFGIEGENQEKAGKKGENREGSFTLPLLTEGAGYATVDIGPILSLLMEGSKWVVERNLGYWFGLQGHDQSVRCKKKMKIRVNQCPLNTNKYDVTE